MTEETVNLAVGDELTLGPALVATSLRIIIASQGPEPNIVVRDALRHRADEIERLRRQVADLEAEKHATADEIAEAVFERIRERLG